MEMMLGTERGEMWRPVVSTEQHTYIHTEQHTYLIPDTILCSVL